jgi:hypothetical protein
MNDEHDDTMPTRVEYELDRLASAPLAQPEPIEQLRRRARRRRARHAGSSLVALGAVVALVAGLVALRADDPAPKRTARIRVQAPNVVLGDIDAVVVSANFDGDGARAPISRATLDTVAHIPGVQVASGVLQTFATVLDGTSPGPPRTPILFSYHEPSELTLVRGRLPVAPNELVVNPEFVSRQRVDVGGVVDLAFQDAQWHFTVVGVFELPQGSTQGIPLAAVAAAQPLATPSVDRIDVKVAPNADPATVRARIATALGPAYAALSPTELGYTDQRLAQLQIQHAYWSFLSPDPTERHGAAEGRGGPAQGDAEYERRRSEVMQAEFRVERVTFLSPDSASLVYRLYYSGSPSPIINAPQTGAATRVDGVWKLASSTQCQIAALGGLTCEGQGNTVPVPPAGWQSVSTLAGDVARAYTSLADPDATLAERVAAVADGEARRSEIEAGLAADQQWKGKVHFLILGWRQSGESTEVLYAVSIDDNGPATPWPLIAPAVQTSGHWYAAPQYACGLQGLANGACGMPNG